MSSTINEVCIKKLIGYDFNLYIASASSTFNISYTVKYLSNLFFKLFTESILTTVSGRLFQTIIVILLEKESL